MSLHDRIDADLRDAMRARDRSRISALRMVIAALKNRATADGLSPQGRLDDGTVQQVLSAEIKRRRDAAQAFADAGRDEAAANERAEAALYESYLPEQLSDAELETIVDEAIATTNAEGPKDMGPVMKTAMAAVAGRAEGGRVSAIVKHRLAG